MISDKHKCIHIHIPKTGGTSLAGYIWTTRKSEKHLWSKPGQKNKYQEGALQHLFASNIKKVVGDERFNSYYKFSMVRNPWDKLVSCYCGIIEQRPDLCNYVGIEQTNKPSRASFTEFIKGILVKKHVQWEPQFKFLYDENGRKLFDYVGRYELYERGYKHVMETLGIKYPLIPHLRKTKHTHYTAYYTHETRQIVAEHYALDIKLYNYGFYL